MVLSLWRLCTCLFLAPPAGKERGHRPCPRAWHAGRLDPALRLLSHTGGLRAFGSTQEGHSAGPPCAPSGRGRSPRPVSSPTCRHRPLLSLGEKSHPGTHGCCFLPARPPPMPSTGRGRAVAVHPLLNNPPILVLWEGPGHSDAIIPVDARPYPAHLGAVSLRLRPSPPALCVGAGCFRLPITGRPVEKAVPRGRTRPRRQLPALQQKCQDVHRPLAGHRAVSPLLRENVDFVGARAGRQIFGCDEQTSPVPVEGSTPRWCSCTRTCLGLMGAAHRMPVDPNRQHRTSTRLPRCSSARQALRPHVPSSPHPLVPTSPHPVTTSLHPVTSSPHPFITSSPCPLVPTSPRPQVPSSPRPLVTSSPRPHAGLSFVLGSVQLCSGWVSNPRAAVIGSPCCSLYWHFYFWK